MKKQTKKLIFAIICILSGLMLIAWQNWIVAVGLFLFTIGNNIEQASRWRKLILQVAERLQRQG